VAEKDNEAKQAKLEWELRLLKDEMIEMEFHNKEELKQKNRLIQTLLEFGMTGMGGLRDDIANITDCEHAEEFLELIEAWNNNVKEQLNEIALDDE